MAQQTCQVCQKTMSNRWINRHLVSVHGWRYRIYKDQPDEPVEVPKWWRPRDLKGHFIKHNERQD